MRTFKTSCAAPCVFFGSALAAFSSCVAAQVAPQTPTTAKIVGTLSDARLDESSGLAASRRFAGMLWTHNDSGDSARVFLLNARGQTVLVVNFNGANARDYEDIAVAGKGKNAQVYVGDIGDNKSKRDSIDIYRFAESAISPNAVSPNAISSTRTNERAPQVDLTPQKMTLRYPDGAHDAETLIATADGFLIIVTKTSGVATIFKTPRPFSANATQTLVEVGRKQFGGIGVFTRLATGGDLSSDEKRVVVRTYSASYEWTLPTGKNKWREVWNQSPRVSALPVQPQGEGICYALDNRSWFLSSEEKNSALWQMPISQ